MKKDHERIKRVKLFYRAGECMVLIVISSASLGAVRFGMLSRRSDYHAGG